MDSQMLNMVDDLLKPYANQVSQLQAENRELKNKLSMFQNGSQRSAEDYNNLERQYREEIANNNALKLRIQELQNNLNNVNSKSQLLESQLKRANTDMSAGVRDKKMFEDQINELNKKINIMKEDDKKKSDEIFENNEEKKILEKQISDLSKQNDELAAAVEELLARDKELSKVLIERTQYIADVDEKITEYKKKILKYERQLSKFKKDTSPGENEGDQDQNLDMTMNYANVQLELEDAREKIKSLKIRILALEEEERRNERLTDALNKRKVIIERLEKQVDEKEEEILEYRRTKNELIRRIEMFRELSEEKGKENKAELEELRQQVQKYRESYEIAEKRVRKFEEQSGQKMKEVDELQRLLDKKMDGTHGLRQVVNEMKELRAMLDVRDRHIADLVAQINSMDKIMIGLSKQVDPNFDLNNFLKNYDTQNFDDEKLRTEKAARDLAKKMQMMKERGPTPQIRVVLNKDQKPIKTYVYEGDEETLITPNSSRKNKRKISDINHNDAIRITSKQRPYVGQKRFKPEGDTVEEKDKEKKVATYNEQLTQTNKISFFDLLGDEDGDFIEGIQGNGIDRDEWVVNLRRKYYAILQERDDLKRKLEELKAEYEKLLNENKLLQERKQSEHQPSLSKSSLNLEFPGSPLPSQKPTIDRSNYTDRHTQTKKFKYVQDHMVIFNYSKKIHLSKVIFNGKDSNAVLLPSDEERAIFNAKQDALRIELEKVRRESADYKHQLEIIMVELDQLRELRDKMQATIDRLNHQLIKQREQYKEGLSQLRNEADRYAESQVKEALDVSRAQNRLNNENLANLDGPNLDNVSTRMNELNHMKNRLEEQLNEERASSQLAQKQAKHFRERLFKSEEENQKLKDELEKRKTDSKLTDYNAELHIRMKNLQKKYRDLKTEYNELKQSRPARNDPRQFTEHPIDGSDNEDQFATSKNFSVIRSSKTAEAKIMSLKTQNEEMQLKLGKAQATIDRLNQLLQRKEGQVEKLKEQASAFKHQIIAKQKEVNNLRAKAQS